MKVSHNKMEKEKISPLDFQRRLEIKNFFLKFYPVEMSVILADFCIEKIKKLENENVRTITENL